MLHTNLCRVYRPRLKQKHGLALVRAAEDVTGEDVQCRVCMGSSQLVEIPQDGELGISGRTADVWVQQGVDVSDGYFLKIFKSVPLDGRLLTVRSTLRTETTIGDATIIIRRPEGFVPGDNVLVNSAQWCRLKEVSGINATVYPGHEMAAVYAAGSTVEVVEFFHVVSVVSSRPLRGAPTRCVARRVAMEAVT